MSSTPAKARALLCLAERRLVEQDPPPLRMPPPVRPPVSPAARVHPCGVRCLGDRGCEGRAMGGSRGALPGGGAKGSKEDEDVGRGRRATPDARSALRGS